MADIPTVHQSPALNVQDLDRFNVLYVGDTQTTMVDMRTALLDSRRIVRVADSGIRHIGTIVELLQVLTVAYQLDPTNPRWDTAPVDGFPPELVEQALGDLRDHMFLFHPQRPWNQDLSITSVAPKNHKPLAYIDQFDSQSGQNGARWRDLDDYDLAPDPAAIANRIFDFLLSTTGGNQTKNPARGTGKGSGAGAPRRGPLDLGYIESDRVFTIPEGDTLAATLLANMPTGWAQTPAVPTFVDRDNVRVHLNDDCWLAHANDVSLLLSDDTGELRVVVTPRAYPLNVAKTVHAQAVNRFPFALRTGLEENSVGEVAMRYLSFRAGRSMFHNLHGLYDTFGSTDQLVSPQVLCVDDRQYPNIPLVRIITHLVGVTGTPTNVTLAQATTVQISPDRFALTGEQAQEFVSLLATVEGLAGDKARTSVVASTRMAITNAVVPSEGTRSPAQWALANRLADQATVTIWQAVDQIAGGCLDRIRNGEPGQFTDEEHRRIVDAALDGYDQVCKPYANATRTMATVIDQRNILNAKLRRA